MAGAGGVGGGGGEDGGEGFGVAFFRVRVLGGVWRGDEGGGKG